MLGCRGGWFRAESLSQPPSFFWRAPRWKSKLRTASVYFFKAEQTCAVIPNPAPTPLVGDVGEGSAFRLASVPSVIRSMSRVVLVIPVRLSYGARGTSRDIMDPMKRTVVWLTPEQLVRLSRISKKTGAPISSLVRKAVEEFLKRDGRNRRAKV
jgi:Ribbon-helix-helix domain